MRDLSEEQAGRFLHPGTSTGEHRFAFPVHDLDPEPFGRLVYDEMFLQVLQVGCVLDRLFDFCLGFLKILGLALSEFFLNLLVGHICGLVLVLDGTAALFNGVPFLSTGSRFQFERNTRLRRARGHRAGGGNGNTAEQPASTARRIGYRRR